ncbi:Rieske (2Fe-2S) protein [Candidatus Halobonum tyrrellensis]|nr:Rieske 2Fe-2S domain-containing protein [Candidatus Halobonum tyrrellensis]
MTERTRLASLDDVPDRGSVLFTAVDGTGTEEEVIVVPCDDDPGVEAWVNRCTHENYRLDRGRGAAMRDGQVICPKHGSMFDACSGHCDNGKAAGTTLVEVEVAVEDGAVFLADDEFAFAHEGGIDDGDGGPGSTSHLSF